MYNFLSVIMAIRKLQSVHEKTDYNLTGFPFYFRDRDVVEIVCGTSYTQKSYNHIARTINALKKCGVVSDADMSRWGAFGYTYVINY